MVKPSYIFNGFCRLSAAAFLVALLSFVPGQVFSQKFTATVNRNPVGLNEQFQLSFELNTTGSSFRPPSLADFMVLSGPNQSTSMQFINGSMSQSISFNYILQPRNEGTFKIEPATIDVGGKSVQSNAVSITVTKGSGQSSQQGSQQGGDDKTNISSKNIFFRVSVDKSTVYRGEAIVATYKLYTNVQVLNYGINKVPAFNGFWSQEMQMPQRLSLDQTEVINGVRYNVGEIKKVVLFPQQSGTLTLEPMEGECIARIQVKRGRSNNPFDIFNDPFFNDPFSGFGGLRDVKFAVKSDPVRITVKELPPNAPAGFNGAVGHFTLEGNLNKTKLKTNDAASLKLKISGKGNLKLIDAPEFEVPQDIEKYDPEVSDNVTVNERGASGSRTFEYLLIPRVQGKYELGPVSFTYFDLDKKNYVTLNTTRFNMEVERSKDGAVATSITGKADFQLLGRDIRFIKTATPSFIVVEEHFYGSLFFWLMVLIPIVLLIVIIVVRKKQEAANADIAMMKSRKATKMARKRLEIANGFLKAGNHMAFYDETGKALWGYLSDKLKIPVSTLTKENSVEKLKASGVSDETVNSLVLLIDYCEYARFARMDGAKSHEEIYQETVTLITRLENEVKA